MYKFFENTTDVGRELNLMNPARIVLMGLIIIVLFIGGLITWASFAQISGAVVAPAEIQVAKNRKTVQHLEGGIVQDILVEEGSRVNKGDLLIRLEAENVLATRDMYRVQLNSLKIRLARLESEKDYLPAIKWSSEALSHRGDPKYDEMIQNEEKVFNSRRMALEGQISLIDAQVEQLKVQVESGETQLVALSKVIASLNEEINAKRVLLSKHYMEKSQIMALERDLEGSRLQEGQIVGNIAQSRQKIAELKLRIEDLMNQYKQQVMEELSRVQSGVFEMEDRLRPLEDASQRLDIVAPVSGVVMALKVHSKGGVIGPREPLLDIVPHDNPLILAAKVDVRRIADVTLGQEANVMLTAFKQRITPKVKGTVSHISADRMEEQSISGKMPYYLVYVDMDKASLKEAIGDESRLTAGMPAEVFITTKTRSVMSYLLEPLTLTIEHAFREQ